MRIPRDELDTWYIDPQDIRHDFWPRIGDQRPQKTQVTTINDSTHKLYGPEFSAVSYALFALRDFIFLEKCSELDIRVDPNRFCTALTDFTVFWLKFEYFFKSHTYFHKTFTNNTYHVTKFLLHFTTMTNINFKLE